MLSQRFWYQGTRLILLLLGVWLLFDLVAHLTAEVLWFQEVGYLWEYVWRLGTQLGIWAIATGFSLFVLLSNLIIASHFSSPQLLANCKKPAQILYSPSFPPLSSPKQTHGLSISLLLPTILGLTSFVALIVSYYTHKVGKLWFPQLSLPQQVWQFPPWLKFLLQNWQWEQINIPLIPLGVFLVLVTFILINYQLWLRAIAIITSIILGTILSPEWVKVLQYFHRTPFARQDPLFHHDISFYIFCLPVWQFLCEYFLSLSLLTFATVTLIYLRSGNSLSEGIFPGFSLRQRMHLNLVSSFLMFAVAGYYWLLRYQLLYSTNSVNYGANYTAVHTQLPIYTGLSLLAVAIAIYLLARIYILFRKTRKFIDSFPVIPYPRQLFYTLGIYLLFTIVVNTILPIAVNRLIVQPNELTRERPYIERTIKLTREAFNLHTIEVEKFIPQGKLTLQDIQKNDLTIRNIRLWDTYPLLQSNRQLQQIRPYYRFPDADIDRYNLKREATTPIAEKQQTIIAARELDSSNLPPQAQTWVNQHLIYTHGYGFTLSPVNTVAPGGLPDYYIKDIGEGTLQISNPSVRESIPVNQPRIYYGEITQNYVMTGTKTQEFDYPSGADNVYNVYDGRGGISIGSFWRRIIFAQYLKDWQMLLTRNFTPQTKLLCRRQIIQRVQAIAPFLQYDSNPYLVAAAGDGSNLAGKPNYLYWIIDAYTTSDRYPYSDPGKHKFNYIRNSVKVVIDAYNGSINFYITDDQDPVIHSFHRTFPQLFKSLATMPAGLKNHIRYPLDLFSIQSERLLSYHMTDPQVFYNREDLWQIPSEIYGNKPQPVEPYYLITKLPTGNTEEFILLLPFTPTQRSNLIAWLAARSDGQEYGKLLLYEFPKQQLVYGTQQVEALINQDPVISQKITLWNREGSRVIQGNLLVIPIEQSLLYVEPLYLEAEQNSLPTLIRVIVVYDNRIVIAETLQQALTAIFQTDKPTTPAIVRPVQ
ncbi:UPF0182 family protein [Calothrix sp. 336/3]|uniref:UPF0182 family protein n=1 Tax=Calothrix sp. 336/3 TaxID=1337936 RepID=UPI0004E2AE54|nr:UPF0182 family protein [Calothrix sp. 336/3]AKG21966.1 hypothetical protein IJ00_12480 [Calothrix sp. 336/3]